MSEGTADQSLIWNVRRIYKRNLEEEIMPLMEMMHESKVMNKLEKRLASLEEVVQGLPQYFQRQEQLEARTAQMEKFLQKTMEVLIPRLDRVLVEIQQRSTESTEGNLVGVQSHSQSSTGSTMDIPATPRNTCQHEKTSPTTISETEFSSSPPIPPVPVICSEEVSFTSTLSQPRNESPTPIALHFRSSSLPTGVASTSVYLPRTSSVSSHHPISGNNQLSMENVGSNQPVTVHNSQESEYAPYMTSRALLRRGSAVVMAPSEALCTAGPSCIAPAGGSLYRPSASFLLPSTNTSPPADAVSPQSLPAHDEPPLMAAAARGDAGALRRLLAAGSGCAEERDAHGDTALHAAAAAGHCEALLALLAAWANADARGRRLRTPLHCACAKGHVSVARRLLRAGADPKAEDADGATPLALAAEQGHTHVVKVLLKRGAAPGARDKRGLTPATRASAAGHTDALAALLRGGVSPDERDASGQPLLVHAARADHWDAVQLLLQSGASALASSPGGVSPLALAAEGGHVEAVRELLRYGGGRDPSQAGLALARAASPAIVWAFVDAAPYALRGAAGRHALLSALLGGRIEVVKALLDAGVEVGKDTEGEDEEQILALLALLAKDRITMRKKSTRSSFKEIFRKHKKK